MEDAAACAEVAAAAEGAAALDEVTEVKAVDGGGTPYSIVDVVTVLAVDPGRLMLEDAEDTLVTVEAVAAAADEAAPGVGSSVVPEDSVVICS